MSFKTPSTCLLFPDEHYPSTTLNIEKVQNYIRIENLIWNFTYYIDKEWLEDNDYQLTSNQRVLVLKDVFLSAENGLRPIITSQKVFENFTVFDPSLYVEQVIDHSRKTDDLLELISVALMRQPMFFQVDIKSIPYFKVNIMNQSEFLVLLRYLEDKGLIKKLDLIGKVSLTVNGYEYLRVKHIASSKNVFIAMQFKWTGIPDESEKKLFLNSISEACKEFGLIALPVSESHTGYITDQIIREIRQSKFMIADFTYNNHGAYFEAGFARALGKSVIHTVHEAHKSDLHFDIKQINTIRWNDASKLQHDLINRLYSLGIV